ncbi:hypothetical protein EV652_106381 [Kribbella steppae]|uniref:VCBS repeat protein n=1 Tax=Kribbella steppae TaxID=2512223 RepID=A0A4R2HKT7_9ACTN|nr:hypothetical protein [Kribbella steppae]TCO28395.1 hypothetical protein EV652_106381 [Kribbella steppae]
MALVGSISLAFGNTGDIPVIGDWDGDYRDDLGVYRPWNRSFYPW